MCGDYSWGVTHMDVRAYEYVILDLELHTKSEFIQLFSENHTLHTAYT